jgi:hypothetical protein
LIWTAQRLGHVPQVTWTPILGVVLPGAFVLGWQSWFTLASGRMEESKVVWAPFAAIFHHVPPDVPLLLLKLLLSILFPLWVTLSHLRTAAKEQELLLAWVTFGCGITYAYGLAESGPRLAHGNFLWSGQVAVWILFVASAGFLARRWRASAPSDRWTPRVLVGLALFALHVAGGLAYALRFAGTGEAF